MSRTNINSLDRRILSRWSSTERKPNTDVQVINRLLRSYASLDSFGGSTVIKLEDPETGARFEIEYLKDKQLSVEIHGSSYTVDDDEISVTVSKFSRSDEMALLTAALLLTLTEDT